MAFASYPLEEGYLLAGRYVIGPVRRVTDSGISYRAEDRKLHLEAEIFEYFPIDYATRQPDSTEILAREGFRERMETLRRGTEEQLRSAASSLYDIVSENGTLYLIQQKRNAAEPAVSAGAKTEMPPAQDTAETRIVEGLYPTAEMPVSTFAHQLPPEEEPSAILIPPPRKQPQPSASETDTIDGTAAAKHRQQKKEPVREDAQEPESLLTMWHTPRYRILLCVLAAGLLLLIVCSGILLSSLLHFSDTGRRADSLLGVPAERIVEVLGDTGYQILGRGQSSQYAPGSVIAEEKRKDGTFCVILNGETPVFTVPDLTGMSLEGARAYFARTRYRNTDTPFTQELSVTWVDSAEAPHGTVLSQTPASGTTLAAGQVCIEVANHPASLSVSPTPTGDGMPDFTGTVWKEEKEGHRLVICDRVYHHDAVSGVILSQYPAPGAQAGAEDVCYVVVSLGEEKAYVPDLRYAAWQDAQETLANIGLSCAVRFSFRETVADGLVWEQTPAAGDVLPYGSTVTLEVAGNAAEQSPAELSFGISSETLAVGDIYSISLSDPQDTVVYHSGNPAVLRVEENGNAVALRPGYATLCASVDGATAVLPIFVEYPARLPVTAEAKVGEKLSLPALASLAADSLIWYWDSAAATVEEDGTFTGIAAGSTTVVAWDGNTPILFHISLQDAQTKTVYKQISKAKAADSDTLQKLLQESGLSCTVTWEDGAAGKVLQPKGTVLRIRYTGYSDGTYYYIAEGSAVTLFVSSGKSAVLSIAIAEKPRKTTYVVGEALDPAGLAITVCYTNGDTETRTDGFTTSYDFSQAGRRTVAVSYAERKASFAVEVVEKTEPTPKPVKTMTGLEITSLPARLSYTTGEPIDGTGLQLRALYSDGTTEKITEGYTLSGDTSQPGERTITIVYGKKSANYTIHVSAPQVSAIEITALPHRSTYTVGDTPSLDGLKLSVTDANGQVSTVLYPDAGIGVEYDFSTPGSQTVTFTYGGCRADWEVTVLRAPLQSITVLILPKKQVYRPGEALDTTGLMLLAEYRDGSSERITEGFTASCDLSRPGDADVLVTFGDANCSFSVTVTPDAVRTEPENLFLTVGETGEIRLLSSVYSAAQCAYTLEPENIVSIQPQADAFLVTALAAGVCRITVSDGSEKMEYIVTVSDAGSKPDITLARMQYTDTSCTYSIHVRNQSSTEMRYTLSEKLTFSPTPNDSAQVLSQPLTDGVTSVYDGAHTITLSGAITVPANTTIMVLYITIDGADPSSLRLSPGDI